MVVRHGQQVGLPGREPVLRRRALAARTVPVAAGVVGDGGMVAVAAAHDMAAERSRAAGPDRSHHLELAATEPVTREIGVAMAVQDVRYLQQRPRHVSAERYGGGGGASRASGLVTSRRVLSATRV